MYSKIINPVTGRKVAINGKLGRTILRKYLFVLSGGAVQLTLDEIKGRHPLRSIQEYTVYNGTQKGKVVGYKDGSSGIKVKLKLEVGDGRYGRTTHVSPERLTEATATVAASKALTVSNPGEIRYNGKDIRLCCSDTHQGVPVSDKMPIPLIYIRAHGMTDSFERTGAPLVVPGSPVVINSLTLSTIPNSDFNGQLGRVVEVTDEGYHIKSSPDDDGEDGEGFFATKKQIMPYFESRTAQGGESSFRGYPERYLEYGTTVKDSSSGKKGVIVSNLDSATGNFKVLFGSLNSSPRLLHHSVLTPTNSTSFEIPPKTYILTFSDVGDDCLFDYKRTPGEPTLEELLLTHVLRPFIKERKTTAIESAKAKGAMKLDYENAQPSDTLSTAEIRELKERLHIFSGQSRRSDLDARSLFRSLGFYARPLFKNNFRLQTPGSKILDTWLDFKNGCTRAGYEGDEDVERQIDACDVTCINTDSMLTNYAKNRCHKYSKDMLDNEFHNYLEMISLRELIRHHGPGIYILSSCRSFVPGTDPVHRDEFYAEPPARDGVATPAQLALQRSEERSGAFWDKPTTEEGLRAALTTYGVGEMGTSY